METRTFEDYQNKKFFVTSDFKTYKWNEKGEITDIDAIITNETWNQIANYLKNQFYNEVDRVTEIWKGKFIAEYKINYDIKHLHKAETKTVIQILRGKKHDL